MINQGLNLAVNGISYFLPLEDKEILIKKLKNNELLTEFENLLSNLVLKGGRFLALGSGICTVISHITTEKNMLRSIDNKNKDVDRSVEMLIDLLKSVDRSVEKC